MSGKQYLKNKIPAIFVNLMGMLALALFLAANGDPAQTVLFIFIVWQLVLTAYLSAAYHTQKRDLDRLLDMTEQLEERYLISEIMAEPHRADWQVFHQILKMAERSMLEKIGGIQRERKKYKEYIEQWIHEVKTPITAMKLLCENNRSPFTRDILAELENIDQYTEQALYYARSEHTEKDYFVREISLCDIVHSAIADNKYLLRQSSMTIAADDLEHSFETGTYPEILWQWGQYHESGQRHQLLRCSWGIPWHYGGIRFREDNAAQLHFHDRYRERRSHFSGGDRCDRDQTQVPGPVPQGESGFYISGF